MVNRPMSEIVSTTLEDRVTLVLREAGEVYGMWQRLEEKTGIAAARWRKAYTFQQRPTPDMVQAICRLRPELAFWIATGITDAENGHKAPASALAFPEWRGTRASDKAAIDYFRASLDLLEVLAAEGKTDSDRQEERLEAFGRRRMKHHWWASSLASVASALTLHGAYKELKRLRKLRESLRSQAQTKPARKGAARKSAEAGLPTEERVDPLTQHLDDSDLYWSPQPS
jgi:hypothetical protein